MPMTQAANAKGRISPRQLAGTASIVLLKDRQEGCVGSSLHQVAEL